MERENNKINIAKWKCFTPKQVGRNGRHRHVLQYFEIAEALLRGYGKQFKIVKRPWNFAIVDLNSNDSGQHLCINTKPLAIKAIHFTTKWTGACLVLCQNGWYPHFDHSSNTDREEIERLLLGYLSFGSHLEWHPRLQKANSGNMKIFDESTLWHWQFMRYGKDERVQMKEGIENNLIKKIRVHFNLWRSKY